MVTGGKNPSPVGGRHVAEPATGPSAPSGVSQIATNVVICPTCGKPGFEQPVICNRSGIDPVLGGAVHCLLPAHHHGAHVAETKDHARTAWHDDAVIDLGDDPGGDLEGADYPPFPRGTR
jgi:hypothetical protein